MKILSAKQIKELDKYTIEHEPIASINLMERASRGVFNWLCQHYSVNTSFSVFCGTGNNGGDGLAIARLLYKHGFKVNCHIIKSDNYSEDNLINQERLESVLNLQFISSANDLSNIKHDIIVDAILGSGLNNSISGIYSDIIHHINNSKKEIVAIDIASGLFSDKTSKHNPIVQPCFTLSFEHPKLAFMQPENEAFVGNWSLIDITLSEEKKKKFNSPYIYTSTTETINPRSKFSHKGTYGHALLIVGSYGKMGAALLSSKSCLRAGVGLLTTHIPKCGYEIMQIGLPEAMTSIDSNEVYLSELPDLTPYKAIGIGPSLGINNESIKAFEALLKTTTAPLVIDADGLNILSLNKELLNLLPKNTILTPHPKEFERLVGTWTDDYNKLELLQTFSKKHKTITVLKGAHTAICTPEGIIHFNSTGNPAMATAGSGDVLTGIILAYLAQGFSPEKAAIHGVFNHGLAGDRALKNSNNQNIISRDIIEWV